MMTSPESITYAIDDILGRFDPANRLPDYFAVLKAENEHVNLVSRETIADGLPRLAAESLLPLAILGETSFESYLDVGSGGGFPAIPLMLSGRIANGTLVERTLKKAAALRRMISSLGIRAAILDRTFEELRELPKHDLITVRLVRHSPKLLSSLKKALAPGGRLVWYAQPPEGFSDAGLSVETFSFESANDQRNKAFSVFTQKA